MEAKKNIGPKGEARGGKENEEVVLLGYMVKSYVIRHGSLSKREEKR